jgi:hypothetical protein
VNNYEDAIEREWITTVRAIEAERDDLRAKLAESEAAGFATSAELEATREKLAAAEAELARLRK